MKQQNRSLPAKPISSPTPVENVYLGSAGAHPGGSDSRLAWVSMFRVSAINVSLRAVRTVDLLATMSNGEPQSHRATLRRCGDHAVDVC